MDILLLILLICICAFQLWLDVNGLSLARFVRRVRAAWHIRVTWGFSWRVCWREAQWRVKCP